MHSKPFISVANWNLEWRFPKSVAGISISATLRRAAPDLLCLCETHVDFLGNDWKAIYSDSDYGYPIKEGRRKATLWSKWPWKAIDTDLPNAPTGRFVTGLTRTPLGVLRVIGVCIPWKAAHVSTGRKDKAQWEDHMAFLSALASHPLITAPQDPTVLLGDFNQIITPKGAPQPARQMLQTVIDQFMYAEPKHPEHRTVCHTFTSRELVATSAVELSKWHEETRLSDHHGHIHSFMRADA